MVNTSSLKPVLAQAWEETDGEMSVRHGGYSLHLNKDSLELYLIFLHKTQKKQKEQFKILGSTFTVYVPVKVYEEILESRNGIRVFDHPSWMIKEA